MQKIGDIAGSNADGNGEWTQGDPQGSVPATIIMAEFLNTLQRELVAIVEHNSGGLNPNDDAQLIAAIRLIGQPAGGVSLLGQVAKGTGDTLNLPYGQVNIGGNGFSYVLPESQITDWNPINAANHDGSVTGLNLGDNVYLYVVQQSSGIAKWVASQNSTVPNGYTAETSRKVGGFHVGLYRGVANRYNTSYVPAAQIVPNSCWDLQHRPSCDPTGMVEVSPGRLWVDIYLAAEGSGTWPENVPVSAYGATPIKDDVYARTDFHQLLANAGKRAPTVDEFLLYSEGAPAGLDADNVQAWAATGNSGPTTTGAVVKAVSQYNVVDAVGNLWEFLDNHFDLGDYSGSTTPFIWDNAVVNVGQDAATPRGYVQHVAWRALRGGGGWSDGVHAGARSLDTGLGPWVANGRVGIRGVCEAL